MSAITNGTVFKYGIKGEQLAGVVVENFKHDDEFKNKTVRKNESGNEIAKRYDDGGQKLNISAAVKTTAPVKGTVLTFIAGAEDGLGGAASTKYFVEKVTIDGKNSDDLMVTLECVADEYITLP